MGYSVNKGSISWHSIQYIALIEAFCMFSILLKSIASWELTNPFCGGAMLGS
jgi:hypothetical protein